MLSDGRITCFNGVSRPTRSRRLFSLRGSFVSYAGRDLLISRSFLYFAFLSQRIQVCICLKIQVKFIESLNQGLQQDAEKDFHKKLLSCFFIQVYIKGERL